MVDMPKQQPDTYSTSKILIGLAAGGVMVAMSLFTVAFTGLYVKLAWKCFLFGWGLL